MPKVSVIAPTFNMARWLPHAITSVLEQTFRGWELIVVDDGSTDDTPEVVASFHDSRIRLISQENRGGPAARNAGIRAAQGEYIGFLDADDRWLPQKLEKQVPVLDEHPEVVLCYSQAYTVDTDGKKLGIRLPPFAAGPYFHSGRAELAHLIMGNYLCTSTVLCRLSVLNQAGLFNEALRQGSEDFDLWLRLTQRGAVAYIAEPLARYRVLPTSIISQYTAEACRRTHTVLLESLFNNPEQGRFLKPFRRRAYSELYSRLARLAWLHGERRLTAFYLLKAVKEFPPKALDRQGENWFGILIRVCLPRSWGERAIGAYHSGMKLLR